MSAGFGFSPISRVDLVVNVERNHLPFQRDTFGDVYSITRGGTLTAVSAEVRASVLPPHRVSPYGFAGIGGGIARPTVNETFPTPVENDLRIVYFGGGLRVPITRRTQRVWRCARDARLGRRRWLAGHLAGARRPDLALLARLVAQLPQPLAIQVAIA